MEDGWQCQNYKLEIMSKQVCIKILIMTQNHKISAISLHILYYLYFDTVSSHDELTYSEVKLFLVKEFDVVTEYKTITTSSNRTISLSGNHLIFSRKADCDKFYPM